MGCEIGKATVGCSGQGMVFHKHKFQLSVSLGHLDGDEHRLINILDFTLHFIFQFT